MRRRIISLSAAAAAFLWVLWDHFVPKPLEPGMIPGGAMAESSLVPVAALAAAFLAWAAAQAAFSLLDWLKKQASGGR